MKKFFFMVALGFYMHQTCMMNPNQITDIKNVETPFQPTCSTQINSTTIMTNAPITNEPFLHIIYKTWQKKFMINNKPYDVALVANKTKKRTLYWNYSAQKLYDEEGVEITALD